MTKQPLVFMTILTLVIAALSAPAAASSAPHFRVLYAFHLTNDGGFPGGGVIADAAGDLYGTTQGGGYANGTAYELVRPATPGGTWTETTLHTFAASSEGLYPTGGLVFDGAGDLFGTTPYGGDTACIGGCGVIFELTPPAQPGGVWSYQVLYRFKGGHDGTRPYQGSLILDAQGDLYGTTLGGGRPTQCSAFGCGTVFELAPPQSPGGQWSEQIIHRFGNGTDGTMPFSGLIFDRFGDLYGTTREGGPLNVGTAFELRPPAQPGSPWSEMILHRFGQRNFDGQFPTSKLIFDRGVLLGTTQSGGNGCSGGGCGTVFSLTPPAPGHSAWTETILHSFDNFDGEEPDTRVIFDRLGNLYGTTYLGGLNGTVFQLAPAGHVWTETTLYQFTDGNDGAGPVGDLIGGGTRLFGVTNSGGAYGAGTIFEIAL